MVRRFETDPVDRDEKLGEAIEAFLALAEAGESPDPEAFVARYPELDGDLQAALEGLALVQGLVGDAGGPGHRLESGRRIAGYRIVRELGRGGMGTVYEAVHVGLDRPVALKVLGTHAAPDSTGRRRFLNEARTAAGLHHTHIVPVFDVGQVGGLCYYAMQRIEGSGLDSVLRHLRRDRTIAAGSSQGGSSSLYMSSGRRGWTPRFFNRSGLTPQTSYHPEDDTATWVGRSQGDLTGPSVNGSRESNEPPPFDPPRGSAYYRWVAEVGREAAEALSHAHRRGIIHRDIKPSNLLVDARGVVWVADFGLARRLSDPGLTQHDSLLGTPRYMSPEQAKTGAIDGRSDIYSLGATLYELLTLRPPFQGQTAAELVAQIGMRDPVAARQFDPRIPRDLETIVLKALAKRPVDRYASAMDFAEDLERFLHHEPVRARRISPVGRLWRFMRRNPTTSIVTATAAATVMIVTSAAFVRVVHERDQTRAAIRMQLWREASLVRLSNVPNRRAHGLELLKEAAAMGPEPALRTKLRDEAVEFLVLRNVEARPELPTGPSRGLVFGPEGTHLAALAAPVSDAEGDELSFWDVATRKSLHRHKLNALGLDTGPTSGALPSTGSRRWGPGPTGITAIGQCVAVLSPDRQGIHLFDAASAALLRDLKMPGHHLRSIFAVPDGQHFVTIEAAQDTAAGRPDEGQGHRGGRNDPRHISAFEVCLYDPEQLAQPLATLMRWNSGSPGREPGVGNPIVAISPDGKTVATAGYLEPTVSLWAAEDGRLLGKIDTQTELTAIVLGPSNLLATAGNGAVRLWETDSKTSLPGFTPYQSYVRLLRFNPKGTLLAVGGGGTNIELWDPASLGDVMAVLPTSDPVVDVAFSPDGQNLAAAIRGGTTSVWSINNPVARVQLSGFDAPLTNLAFRTDGLLAMGSMKGVVRTWKPGQCPGSIQDSRLDVVPSTVDHNSNGYRPSLLAFDDHDRLITIDADALTRTWIGSSKSHRAAKMPLPENRGAMGIGRMFPAPMARVLGGQTLFLARDSQILVWHSDTPDRVQLLALPNLPSRLESEHDSKKGEAPRPHLRTEMLHWRQLAANATGDRLYLLNTAGDVHALALAGTRARRLDWDLPGGASSIAISPDSATLAIGDHKGNITLVNTEDGKIQTRLRTGATEAEGRILTLAFSPNGRELAVGTSQGPVEIWSLSDTTAPLLRLPGHRGIVTTLAYDPKGHYLATGRFLATGGADKLVDVWDLERIRSELDRIGLAW